VAFFLSGEEEDDDAEDDLLELELKLVDVML